MYCNNVRKIDDSGMPVLQTFRNFTRNLKIVQFSPFDLLIFIRLMIILLVWKYLSTDYSALASLAPFKTFYVGIYPSFFGNAIVNMQQLWFSEMVVKSLQFFGGIICLLSLFYTNRFLLILIFICIYPIEISAYLYRGQLYDIDIPMAIIVICVFYPGIFRHAVNSDKQASEQATTLGTALAIYVSGMYFFAGISKIIFSYKWVLDVSLENAYLAIKLYNLNLPPAIDRMAIYLSNFFYNHSTIQILLNFFTLLEQIFYFLIIFVKRLRVVLPFSIFLMHMGILLTTGIFFSSMPFVGLFLFVPWSKLMYKINFKIPITVPKAHSNVVLRRMYYCCALVFIILPAIMAQYNMNYTLYPFANYNQFGWIYKGMNEQPEVYALGFYDDQTHQLLAIPHQYGGFMDFRHPISSAALVETLLKSSSTEQKIYALNQIKLMLKCFRPKESNKWLLGSLAMPDHVISYSDKNVDFSKIKEFHLLQGTIMPKDRIHFDILWQSKQIIRDNI